MEIHKINRQLGFVRLPFSLISDSDDSMKEIRKANQVEAALATQISQINDYEISVFRPRFTNLHFDIYFHRLIDPSVNSDIRTLLSKPYTDYYDKMNSYFAGVTKYPTFWNSFGYPFYNQKDRWYETFADGTKKLLPKRFGPQAYLYNSFIKMNVYTTPYAVSQELLFQNIIYVNPRWCSLEGDDNGSWHRPTFKLDETTDGYYLYWLNNYTINSFYVSFQFWDALNGKMINLLPSNVQEPSKHWVQSVDNGFDPRMMYMKYKISYNSKTYGIFEFDASTQTWDKQLNPIHLYELVFDDAFATQNPKISVMNGTATANVVPPTLSNFNMVMNASLRDLTPSAAVRPVPYEDGFNFQYIRAEIKQAMDRVPEKYVSTIKIKNNGTTPAYIKNIEISLKEQGESTRTRRIDGSKRNLLYLNDKQHSTYVLNTVPNYDTYQDHGLQKNFDVNFHPDRNNTTGESDSGGTTSVQNIDDGKQWWESVAWFGWYYPITESNFSTWGDMFAERLFITHEGDDLTPIDPNSEITLDLSFGFGAAYGYTNIEPYFYTMCHRGAYRQGDTEYVADLTYEVKVYFNDLRSSLPVTANIQTFTVTSKFVFSYLGAISANIGREHP